MSYDREIGIDPNNPSHLEILRKLDLTPNVRPINDFLPCDTREPEPKIILADTRHFALIRKIVGSSPNSAVFQDQIHEEKNPLVSFLLDSKSVAITLAGHNLRFRFEMRPNDGKIYNEDFNEKSCNSESPTLGGLIDRTEMEREALPHETNRQAYQNFIGLYRPQGGLCCQNTAFEDLCVYAGYITRRNEYPFIVKHPDYPFAVVFEACEDITKTLEQRRGKDGTSCYFKQTGRFVEFEFEPKKICGIVPDDLQRDREVFKRVLYDFMRRIQESIHQKVPDSSINYKSKAQITQENLMATLIRRAKQTQDSQLVRQFGYACAGENRLLVEAIKYKALSGLGLEDSLRNNRGSLLRIAREMSTIPKIEHGTALSPDLQRAIEGTPLFHRGQIKDGSGLVVRHH
jgi:hypothetical protein